MPFLQSARCPLLDVTISCMFNLPTQVQSTNANKVKSFSDMLARQCGLPHLHVSDIQDLAFSFHDNDGGKYSERWCLPPPCVVELLVAAAAACPRLRSLSLREQRGAFQCKVSPDLAGVSRLSRLTALTVHDAQAHMELLLTALTALTALHQLSLVEKEPLLETQDVFAWGYYRIKPLRHTLSKLTSLHTLQVSSRPDD